MRNLKDKMIIESAKMRNETAFYQLYKLYYNFVFNTISKKSNDKSIIEEICSITFKKAFSKITTFDEKKAKFSTWLITIAINTLKDHNKSKKDSNIINPSYSDKIENIIQTDNSESIEEKMDKEIIHKLFNQVLEKLSSEDRKVVDLFYYKDMSYKEITLEMNLSVDVVKVRLYRAKTKLKSILLSNKNLLVA
jgi:RNA polymerase sigma factor (sigma-70 family)